jgi:hypothetical protein
MIVGRWAPAGLGVFGDPNKRPELRLNGDATMTIRQGRVWYDPGALVIDDRDGPLTVYSGVPVDTSVGDVWYDLPYNYIDTGGLKAVEVIRRLYIEPLPRGNGAFNFIISAGPQ